MIDGLKNGMTFYSYREVTAAAGGTSSYANKNSSR
jgi:hypothetical protein